MQFFFFSQDALIKSTTSYYQRVKNRILIIKGGKKIYNVAIVITNQLSLVIPANLASWLFIILYIYI